MIALPEKSGRLSFKGLCFVHIHCGVDGKEYYVFKNQFFLISSILVKIRLIMAVNKLIFIISFLLLALLLSWFGLSDSCYDAGGRPVFFGFDCEGANFDFIPLWSRLDAWPYWLILITFSIVSAATITKIFVKFWKWINGVE